ncbi:trehalose-phosphatase [Fodinicurvata sp. EGI_FJ10296]|uniref:trehalose-phosphatase n=1 Tax=Fodinicurvata sp. EGI_FJ10296 TaxID=3231908 RepID=UPI0034548AC3
MSRPATSGADAAPGTRISAVLFDMDGVVTDTATAHFAAWKQLFDAYLRSRTEGDAFEPFTEIDYRIYVDGKLRYDGVRSFLESRGILLPRGDEDDAPGRETICGLGNRKNRYFNAWLEENRTEAFPGTLALMDKLKAAGVKLAVFSSSRNAAAVLRSAGVLELFDAKVDGEDMAELDLPGKPDPAILVQSLERLGARVEGAAVVEDASSGVEAGVRGGFSPVIGVAREGHRAELADAGADIVLADLGELDFDPTTMSLFVKTLHNLPLARDREDELRERLAGKRPVVFLDYDGTLTPIVEDPKQAILSDGMKQAVKRLALSLPTAIVSGRDLDDVRAFVGLDGLFYAGSHGFAMAGPGGWREDVEQGKAFLPDLDRAESALSDALRDIEGASVERKSFSLAVHFRKVNKADMPDVEDAVDAVMARFERLRHSAGKKIFDVKPRTDWHKGRALTALLERRGLDKPDVVPVYLGDDTTDEDAFRAISRRGIGLVVRDEKDRPTAARYALADTADVERFLEWLATHGSSGN